MDVRHLIMDTCDLNIYPSSHHDIHDWSKDFHNFFFFSVRGVNGWNAKSE